MANELIPPRLDEFRTYYNRSLHPELQRLDAQRVRILRGMMISFIGVVVTAIVFSVADLGFLNILLFVPVVFYGGHLFWRLRQWRDRFKPAVMQLILDFLNDSLNYRSLSYDAKRGILRDRFERSGLFRPHADSYQAEDYIRGIVGEMVFEMGEAYVRELSPASNKIALVFSGLFVHAVFNENNVGQIAVWPRRRVRRSKRVIDRFVSAGGKRADIEIMNAGFREAFAVYARSNSGTVVKDLLPLPMQDALLAFHRQTDRDVYFAVHNKDLFIGLESDYDLLEPHLFRTNISYALVRQFYADITLMLGLIADFDQTR